MAGTGSSDRARGRMTWMAERAFGLEAIPVRTGQGGGNAEIMPHVSPAMPSKSVPPTIQVRTPASPKLSPTARPTGKQATTPAINLGPITGLPLSSAQKRIALEQLNLGYVKSCTKCVLHEQRTQTVFGEGDFDAQIMFIGEGPGENEDLSGRPFVGRAGELLDRMITNGMGLQRSDVYICNIVKCRPPGNRAPLPDETAACTPYLVKQIETIRPKVIVTLGAPAAKYILQNDKLAITRIRGMWHDYRGIKVMPTFHPAYILRQYTAEVRGQVWSDLQSVLRELGLPIPKRSS